MAPITLTIPKRVWIQVHEVVEPDHCDVTVEMEDGTYYNALFVTLQYLHRQMQLSYEVGKQMPDTPPVRYALLETPHILVEKLDRETIEDTIDNLLALDVFETMFTQVLDNEIKRAVRGKSSRTMEMSAVRLTDVLLGDGATTVA